MPMMNVLLFQATNSDRTSAEGGAGGGNPIENFGVVPDMQVGSNLG